LLNISEWMQKLKKGDTAFFKPPKGKLLADNRAKNFELINDITSLSHLYEINCNLAVSKSIFGFIYAGQDGNFFPDIDGNFVFTHHIIITVVTNTIVSKIITHLPKNLNDAIACIFGHYESASLCITI